MTKRVLWAAAIVVAVFVSLYVAASRAPYLFGAAGSTQQHEVGVDPYKYMKGAPEKFDGQFLYHAAWQAYMDMHRKLADPKERAKFATWEHKFDTTGDLNTEEGTDRAIRMMRDSLGERFDYVLTSAGTKAEKQQNHSDLVGIGIPIGLVDMKGALADLPKSAKGLTDDQKKDLAKKALTIRPGHELQVADQPFEGAPAFGVLKKGDIIVSVDGVKVEGMTMDEAVTHITGKSGTKVDITIKRVENGVETTPTFTFTRSPITRHAVHVTHKDGVAVIKLDDFVADTGPDDFAAAVEDANENSTGVVLDLRNNGGGIVEYAINMISNILPKGEIMVQVERVPGTDLTIYDETDLENGLRLSVQRLATDPSNPHITPGERAPLLLKSSKPLVVIINGGSASASEIAAGALQRNHRAKIVGTPSIGKGVGQIVVPLPYGRSLHVTNFEFMPGGFKSDWIGIIPDIQVDRTAEDIDAGKDPQLDAALGQIAKEIADNAKADADAKAALAKHQACFGETLKRQNAVDALPIGADVPEELQEGPDCSK